MFAGDIDIGAFKNFDHACRCARNEAFVALHQAARVDRVESVDVLFGIDEFENLAFVDVFWKRQLDENAIDIVAFV